MIKYLFQKTFKIPLIVQLYGDTKIKKNDLKKVC